MTEDELKTTLSDDIKQWVKASLVDAKIADMELCLSSFSDKLLIYAQRGTYQNRLFAWRRAGKRPRPVRIDRPLAIEEAMQLVEDNWERRTFVRPT